jgi:predicted ABC-type ATPase
VADGILNKGLESRLCDKPRLLIVGGPNGSGKTTVAKQYASAASVSYLGADEIAASLNTAALESVRIEAGRQFIRSVDQSIFDGRSCVVESTLSGRTIRNSIIKASDRGFEITIAFVFVDSVDVCVERVAQRVRKGGHDVPKHDIRRRYHRSIHNFWTMYRELADNWVVMYNGGSQIQDVSMGSHQQITVRDESLHIAFMALIESNDD